jgi:hypothetical protein
LVDAVSKTRGTDIDALPVCGDVISQVASAQAARSSSKCVAAAAVPDGTPEEAPEDKVRIPDHNLADQLRVDPDEATSKAEHPPPQPRSANPTRPLGAAIRTTSVIIQVGGPAPHR